MVYCDYVMDIIITYLETPRRALCYKNLITVDVITRRFERQIYSNRINVNEFPVNDRGFEFRSDSNEMKDELKNGIVIRLCYCNEVIGTGLLTWPGKNFDEVHPWLHNLLVIGDCTIFKDELKTGFLEVVMRLQCKSRISANNDKICPEKPLLTIKEEAQKSVFPDDILFVMGQPNVTATDKEIVGLLPPDYDPFKASNPCDGPQLNLTMFRPVHGRLLKSPEILDPYANINCCEPKIKVERNPIHEPETDDHQLNLDAIGCLHGKVIERVPSEIEGCGRNPCCFEKGMELCKYEEMFEELTKRCNVHDIDFDVAIPADCKENVHICIQHDDGTFGGVKFMDTTCPEDLQNRSLPRGKFFILTDATLESSTGTSR